MGIFGFIFGVNPSLRQREADALIEELAEKTKTKEVLRANGITGRIYGGAKVYLNGRENMGIIEADCCFAAGEVKRGKFIITIVDGTVSIYDMNDHKA